MFKDKKFTRLFIIYVLLLIATMTVTLILIYDICDNYEKNSSLTLVNQTIDDLKQNKNLSLTCDFLPSFDEHGNVSYILKDENNEDTCKISLIKYDNTLFDLALFKIDKIEPLKQYTILSTSNIDEYDYKEIPFLKQINESLIDFPILFKDVTSPIYSFNEIEKIYGYTLVKVNDSTYLSLKKLDDKTQVEIKEEANNLVNMYSRYIATKVSKETMLSVIQTRTPLYQRLLSYRPIYSWNKSISINDVKISDAYDFGNNYYLVNASYEFITESDNGPIVDKTTLSLVLKKQYNKYIITEISNTFYYDLFAD